MNEPSDRHIDTNKHFTLEEDNKLMQYYCYGAYYIIYYPNIMNVRILTSLKWGQDTHQEIIIEQSEYHLRYHVNFLFSCVYSIYFVTGCLHRWNNYL